MLSVGLSDLSHFRHKKSVWWYQFNEMELRTDLHIDMSSDLDDRKCKSIYCNRKRSRKKSSNTMSKQFKHNISFSLSILLFIIILIASKRWDNNFTLQLIWHKNWKLWLHSCLKCTYFFNIVLQFLRQCFLATIWLLYELPKV